MDPLILSFELDLHQQQLQQRRYFIVPKSQINMWYNGVQSQINTNKTHTLGGGGGVLAGGRVMSGM